MTAKFLVANTCEDRCGIRRTDELHDGLPVYRCPGCDSTWVETDDAQRPHGVEAAKERIGKLLRHHHGH